MVRLGTRLLLGIPTTGGARMSVRWVEAMASLQMPLGSSMGRQWIVDAHIAEARNRLCQSAIDAGCHYLVFLGDDVLPPPNVLLLLLDKIGRTFPVEDGRTARASMVTGVYWTKSYPSEPYLWRSPGQLGSHRDWRAGDFFPIDLAGCDCLMIEVEMLAAFRERWEADEAVAALNAGRLPRAFPGWFSTEWVWTAGQKPSPIATEDFYFYAKARAYGHRLFADTAIQCFHEDRDTGAMFALTEDMRQAGGEPVTADEDELLVAELGAGLWAPNYGARTRVVRFDGRAEVTPDVRCDLRAIPPGHAGRYDVVHVHHVLEHFTPPRRAVTELLAHWATLLKPGGQLVVGVPNLEHTFRLILGAVEHPGTVPAGDQSYAWAQVYGDQQGYDTAFHRCGFVAATLAAALRAVPGVASVEVETTTGGQNLRGVARYAGPVAPEALDEILDRAVPAAVEPEAPVDAGARVEAREGRLDAGAAGSVPPAAPAETSNGRAPAAALGRGAAATATARDEEG
jgi:SAM-dependent methyltransferase